MGVRRCFFVAVRKRNARTLLRHIREHIRRGSVIHSDEWSAYRGIERMPGKLYSYHTVNHPMWFAEPTADVTTNRIESVWQKLKAIHRQRCGTHQRMLNSYVDELMWRQHYAGPTSLAFQNFVWHVLSLYRVY